MALDSDDAYRSGRLIHWGLQPRQRPTQEPEYQELVERYLDHPEFRTVVKEVAKGLGLLVLEVGEHGIVLGPSPDSIFSLRSADFRPNSSGADDRLLDGLVQLAVASTIFPRARDLEEEATYARPAVTVVEVDENLRRLCERIEEEKKGAPDPVAADEDSGIYEAWRVYQRRLSVMETGDGRKGQRTTRRIIEFGLDRLRDFGCFTKETRGDQVFYQPTWRYQVLVKELAATALYERLHEILQARATPASAEVG